VTAAAPEADSSEAGGAGPPDGPEGDDASRRWNAFVVAKKQSNNFSTNSILCIEQAMPRVASFQDVDA
tara:strand:- start:85 stop:288 length:204 start_codon:yes stop_codon:yes gene_type:complete